MSQLKDFTHNLTGEIPSAQENGEMARRIDGFDWSTTPLGPRFQWPQSLRTAVNILLSSRYQMWMCWGEGLTFLCNDAYRPTLGIKDPWALGRPASEVWAEIWADIGPRIDAVLSTGRATYDEGLFLLLERSGFPEETYHTFSYSPLWDDGGQICGMLCVVTEETDRLIGERRVETLRDVASGLATVTTEREVLDKLADVLERNRKDLPFTLTYLFDESSDSPESRRVNLVSSSGFRGAHSLAPERILSGTDSPWPAQRMSIHPAQILEILPVSDDSACAPRGDWDRPPAEAVVVPIRQQGQEEPAGFFVAGINPYRRFDTGYSGFVDLLSGQIAAALGNSRAWEAERRRAKALAEIDRAKTAFFSNVSHELRTPLTLMLSPVEELLATSGSAFSADQRELLNLVHRNGLRLQKLVNSLLDFARIEAGRMQATFEPVDLATFTADLAANFRSAMERAGLQFSIDCPQLAGQVYVDREMWEKIVFNLLSNALKFTFQGMVRIALRHNDVNVELLVQDTGTGISPSDLPHIFERFRRVEGARSRTIEGTGIGLALVQELVKLHAGTVSVTSTPGEGTTFLISVPQGTAHLPPEKVRHDRIEKGVNQTGSAATFVGDDPAGTETGDLPALRTGERVLLVDDNADMLDYVGRLLGRRYEVTLQATGEAALAAALENPPDLVLSDVMMPGIGGFGLLAELRKHPQTRIIPVILLSARAGEESRVEGLGAGADDYLIKPFTARELLARVGAHLAMKKRREEADRAVRESQSTLQSFYDSTPFLMGVSELDGEDCIAVYGNRAAVDFIGISAQELWGKKGKDLGIPAAIDRLWYEHYKQSQAEGRAVSFEYDHPTRSGVCRLCAVVNYLGDGPNGRPRFSFVAEDVSEKRRADDLLRRSNEELRRANADLEQFAYSASHDLQEPLRQVAVYSQLLQRRYGTALEPKALEYLEWCVEGAHRMEMLVRDLLAYSQAGRVAADSADLTDLDEVVDNVRKNLATTIADTGAVLTVSSLPKLRIDAVPLTQLFQNLISNAIKYRGSEPPQIEVTAIAEAQWWRFSVQDNGIGIPEEFRTQIFGIFKRLHNREAYPGTGIGLAICQRIVERYGGRIWVESSAGPGSTFCFTLHQDKQ